jgi:hypothetical protein
MLETYEPDEFKKLCVMNGSRPTIPVRERLNYKAVLALMCSSGFFLSILINRPGFMSNDSAEQILQGRAGVYSDWHPPIMALLWHYVDQIIPGPLGMLLLQTALIWLGTLVVTLYWFAPVQGRLLSLLPALIVLYPPIFGISGAVWKDIFMWAFLMLALGIAGSIDTQPAPPHRFNYAKCVVAGGLVFIAVLFRSNAVFAAVPIMSLCIARCFGPCLSHRRLMISVVLGTFACLVLVSLSGTVNRSIARCRTNPWASIAVFDIAGTIQHTAKLDSRQMLYERIPARIRGNGSLDRLLDLYNSGYWYGMFLNEKPALFFARSSQPPCARIEWDFDLTESEKTSLTQLWESAVTGHPLAWLSHRLSVFRHVVGFNHDELWSPIYMDPNGFSGQLAEKYGRNPELNKFQSQVKRVLANLSSRWIFRPWIYLLLGVSVVCFSLAFCTDERAQIALVAASGLAHEGGLLLLAPSPDFRYSHYMIYVTLVALLLLLRTFAKHSQTLMRQLASP